MTPTVVDSVLQHARCSPDRPALISGKTSLTYRQLAARIHLAAAWLRHERVEPGARVVIPAEPGDPRFAVAYLATHLAGAVAVPVDAKISHQAYGNIVAQASPALALAGDALARFRRAIDAPAGGSGEPVQADLDGDAIGDVLFTSGSTGRPKGVALPHRSIMAATRNIVSFIGHGPSDREVVTVPLNHSFGLGRMRCTFFVGGTLILVPGLSFPALVFRALEEHAATGLSCVPAGLAVLLQGGAAHLSQFADRLNYMELGSAPMSAERKRMIADILPQTKICMHYGLTEASRSTFLDFHRDAAHLDSVGRATGSVSIRIADRSEKPLADGEVGSIQIRADTVMSHYWDDPEQTRKVFTSDGWLDTGDVGHLDHEGYLYLAGRSDDVINVGGKKVYPLEVEKVAGVFPGVAQCACAGIPDKDGILGEIPALWLVESAAGEVDIAGLRLFLSSELEAHAIPRRFTKVAELPKTESGKLQRSALRAASS